MRVDARQEQQKRFDEADASSSSGVHVVSPGDSLYGVAVYYGVDPRDLIVRGFLSSFFEQHLRELRENPIGGL